MDVDLKQYADQLYENYRMNSLKMFRAERTSFLDTAVVVASAQSPIVQGAMISRLCQIHDAHIERCVGSRFEAYEQAYSESLRKPSDQDLTDILAECKSVRIHEIGQAAKALKEFMMSHGGAPYTPDRDAIEQGSAHGMDEITQRVKTWRARTQLKLGAPNPKERQRQMDKLTQLLNRAEFDQDLASLCAKSNERSPLSLLFMDLDKFKSINDGPGGHDAGDRALKAFANAVRSACDSKGTVYRWGGDEVCVLLPNHCLHEALAVAERIRQTIKATRFDGLPDGLSSSIGAATLHETTSDASKLCSLADRAMYTSKKAGGNQVNKWNGDDA